MIEGYKKRARVKKCKFLSLLNDPRRTHAVVVAPIRRGRSLQRKGSELGIFTRPPLSPRDPSRMHQAVQPVPTYLPCVGISAVYSTAETFTSLANDSARLYRARTLISPLPSRNSERKMNSLAVPTPRRIIISRRNMLRNVIAARRARYFDPDASL